MCCCFLLAFRNLLHACKASLRVGNLRRFHNFGISRGRIKGFHYRTGFKNAGLDHHQKSFFWRCRILKSWNEMNARERLLGLRPFQILTKPLIRGQFYILRIYSSTVTVRKFWLILANSFSSVKVSFNSSRAKTRERYTKFQLVKTKNVWQLKIKL